jgi:hypothetical protein
VTIPEVRTDPTTSTWLKSSLKTALERDPVDALHDAQILSVFTGSKSACATFEEFTTTYKRTDFEFEQQVQGTKKMWVQTGVTRIVENAKPAKVKTKRKTTWTFC